jgi:hypothetical protein
MPGNDSLHFEVTCDESAPDTLCPDTFVPGAHGGCDAGCRV